MEGYGNVWKGRQSGGGTCDGTEHTWKGKDNEGVEMVLMIVHMQRYVISEGQKKKWDRNQHVFNVQGDPSMTFYIHLLYH